METIEIPKGEYKQVLDFKISNLEKDLKDKYNNDKLDIEKK